MTQIKICGLTRVSDALACAELGVDALGINFWPRSPRCCTGSAAGSIVEAVRGRLRLVAVVVDADEAMLRWVRAELAIPWLQLHGKESPETLEALLPNAIKAVHVGSADDLAEARSFGGSELLVDARVEGAPGGTGVVCDWDAAATLAAERRIWLAGGLRPENVAEAIRHVRPHGVDLASGVESAPGVKDLELVRRLVEAVRAADRD